MRREAVEDKDEENNKNQDGESPTDDEWHGDALSPRLQHCI
jgi:hypothetical protein